MRKATLATIGMGGVLLLPSLLFGAEKYALLVGVGRYKHPSITPLEGPPNDVRRMKLLLTKRFGFKEGNIEILLDEEATKDNILGRLRGIREKAKRGDLVVFYFSGHGSYTNDIPPLDEEDGRDEILCPYEYYDKYLLDDELNKLISEFPCRVVVILDACHSGTGTRAVMLSPAGICVPKFAPPPPGTGKAPAYSRSVAMEQRDVGGDVLLAACADSEVAFESLVYEEDGRPVRGGVFTSSLIKAISKAGELMTYEKLVEEVRKEVRQRFSQTPQVSGKAKGAPAFVVRGERPREKFATVLSRFDRKVRLSWGSLEGVTEGSLFRVFPPGEERFSGRGLGVVRIVKVDLTSSLATIVEEEGRITKGCRAVEEEHNPGLKRLFVLLEWSGPPEVGERAKELLRKVEVEGVRIPIEVVGPAQFADRVVRIKQVKDGFVASLLTPDGLKGMEKKAESLEEAIGALKPGLANAFAVKWLASLDNPRPRFKVEVWVDRKDATYKIGQTMRIFFKAERDCYLTLLSVGTSGRVRVLFPNRYYRENRVVGGKVYAIPSEEMPFVFEVRGPVGTELIKAIATTTPLPLVGAGEALTLFKLLSLNEVSALARDVAVLPVTDWASDEVLVRIER